MRFHGGMQSLVMAEALAMLEDLNRGLHRCTRMSRQDKQDGPVFAFGHAPARQDKGPEESLGTA